MRSQLLRLMGLPVILGNDGEPDDDTGRDARVLHAWATQEPQCRTGGPPLRDLELEARRDAGTGLEHAGRDRATSGLERGSVGPATAKRSR